MRFYGHFPVFLILVSIFVEIPTREMNNMNMHILLLNNLVYLLLELLVIGKTMRTLLKEAFGTISKL